jgi:hypothetical protein
VQNVARAFPKVTWAEDCETAFEAFGGADVAVPLHRFYREVERIRRQAGRSAPESLEATIRQTLESNSSDSDNYRGQRDLFYMPQGKGRGIWALRSKATRKVQRLATTNPGKAAVFDPTKTYRIEDLF